MITKVSISKAARLAGISRTHLYRAYINPGKISLSTDDREKPMIEVSELLRVFRTLQGADDEVTENNNQKHQMLPTNTLSEAVLLERIQGLQALLVAKEQELDAYRERERKLYPQLRHNPSHKKRWWSPAVGHGASERAGR